MDENKSGLYMVAIVGVIAVVALVVLVLGATTKETAFVSGTPVGQTLQADKAGNVAAVATNEVVIRRIDQASSGDGKHDTCYYRSGNTDITTQVETGRICPNSIVMDVEDLIYT